MKLATNRDVRDMVALVLARAGDTTGAERLATALEKTFPLDTLVPEILAAHYPGGKLHCTVKTPTGPSNY